jgi:hypothetical protein
MRASEVAKANALMCVGMLLVGVSALGLQTFPNQGGRLLLV